MNATQKHSLDAAIRRAARAGSRGVVSPALLAVLWVSMPALAVPGTACFAPSELASVSGQPLKPDVFTEAETCGACHEAQLKDWKGSLHSQAHEDGIYRAFADLARQEGGDPLYIFCSACHAPAAVVTGEIPGRPHTFLTKEGVTCDGCHLVKDVRDVQQGAGANASLVLDNADVRYGPLQNPATNDMHRSRFSALHASSRLCSACHTLTHPSNGLVIEDTYVEWQQGPYARAGVQCQDCHMRTVAQALTVAATLKPVAVPGPGSDGGPVRPDVHAHTFIGGSFQRELNGASAAHAAAAEQRLKGAARLALRLPPRLAPGAPLPVAVEVTNTSAGHAIPSSITELRQVWISLLVADAGGQALYSNGVLRADGSLGPDAVIFHTILGDAQGRPTYRMWKATRMLFEKLIPPRATVTTTYAVPVPAAARGPLTVRAALHYRSAPQEAMDELFGAGKFKLRVVEMAAAEAELPYP